MEFTKEQQRRVDAARDEFHRATLEVLKEAGESIALEGELF